MRGALFLLPAVMGRFPREEDETSYRKLTASQLTRSHPLKEHRKRHKRKQERLRVAGETRLNKGEHSSP